MTDYNKKGVYSTQVEHWIDEFAEMSHEEPSITQPDQAYTIEQLMDRHRKGILTDLQIQKEAIFYDEMDFDSPDVEKLKDMDIQDRVEFVENQKEMIQNFKDEVDQKRAAEKLAKEQAEAEAEAKKAGEKPASI